MSLDSGKQVDCLRVDGGMVANDRLLQYLANIVNTRVDKPEIIETTASGAAFLAGLKHGIYESLDQISALWQCQGQYQPTIEQTHRSALVEGWKVAIKRTRLNG